MKKILFAATAIVCVVALRAAQPRAEYPRPQFERTEWMNLNGEWTYTFDFVGSGLEKKLYESRKLIPCICSHKISRRPACTKSTVRSHRLIHANIFTARKSV